VAERLSVNLPASVPQLLIDESTGSLLVDFESGCSLLSLDDNGGTLGRGRCFSCSLLRRELTVEG
jgi:hypothetical protein